MPLIAFTVYPEAENPSVVTSIGDFKRDGVAILIQDGDLAQLNGDSAECNSGYDLRVGRLYRDHRNEHGQGLAEDDRIMLLPGNGVIIQTEEWVEFP
jgi:hypothetical protein